MLGASSGSDAQPVSAEAQRTPSALAAPSLHPSQAPLPSAAKVELPAVKLGIRVKLVALMVATTSLIVVALVSYFPARQVAELRAGLRERAEVYARLASQQLRSSVAFDDRETAREVLNAVAKDSLIDGIAVYGQTGALLHAEGALSAQAEQARRGFGSARAFALPGRVLATAPVVSLEGPRGSVVLELSTRSASLARDRLIRVALTAGFAAVVLGTLLAWLIARSLAERVERVADAAIAVSRGDLKQTLQLSGPHDEIGVLAHGFDAMVTQLRNLIRHIQATASEEKARLGRMVRERTVELARKNHDLQLVLDNVDQGFITIDRKARVVGEHSRVIEAWLGPLEPGAMLWEYLERYKPGVEAHFAAAWGQVLDAILPQELTIEQMPQRIEVASRVLRISYKPIGAGEDFDKLLVILSDVTAVVAREQTEQDERDLLNVTSRVLHDRAGFLEFIAETEGLLQRVCGNRSDATLLKRDLHTLKGNSAIYGLAGLSSLCHRLESSLDSLSPDELDFSALSSNWARTYQKLKPVLGQGERAGIEVSEDDYLSLMAAVRRGADARSMVRMLEAWRLEPLRARLARVAEQLAATSARLGKGEVTVAIECPRVFLAREELAEFWLVFSHVVRNAAVHGLQSLEERLARGKSAIGRFSLRAGIDGAQLFVELEDAGPGVDWERVREQARLRGLPCETRADLERALFSDGLSTTDGVDEMAGRGVGLSAVMQACTRQRGSVEVSSARERGTCFRFSWPLLEFPSLTVLATEK